MITKLDINDFFNEETRAQEEETRHFYELDIKDRVKKRKAIKDITIDADYKESKNGYSLRKAIVKVNISDFKVGDYLIIHEDTPFTPISSCILYDILDDGNIILCFSNFNDVGALDSIVEDDASKKFVLDKDIVNLMNIYMEGASSITDESLELINKVPHPNFANNRDEIIYEIKDTEKNFKLSLTDNQREAIANALLAKDYYLIQGPPGTGKSFVIALIILETTLYLNQSVIVSGPNHLAINNVLSKLAKLSPYLNKIEAKVGQEFNTYGLKYTDKDGEIKEIKNIDYLDVEMFNRSSQDSNKQGGAVIGVTPFHMHTSRAKGIKCDTLIIDESGQMNIGLTLMAMSCAKKVILVGDHKQMSPIITSEKHKEDLTKSVFEHLYREYNCSTLDTTFRMNTPICRTISTIFYDGILKSAVGSKRLVIDKATDNPLFSPDAPIVIKSIKHSGTNTSEEEANFCVNSIEQFINTYHCEPTDIAVIAPYRAQCALIRKKLRKMKSALPDYARIAVETVDRMQGQESEIVFISITTGDEDYMSDLTNFIFNPNRFNVAMSRAKVKLILTGNTDVIMKVATQQGCEWIKKIFNSKDVKKI
jgi:DNA replication ATP-dependent helicase Dna2